MDNQEEKIIIKRVQHGERDAYAYLVDAYKLRVFNLCLRMTGSYHDASDLAQETFIKAYEHIKRFNIDKNFYPWLYTIALNVVRNHLKKQKQSLFHQIDDRLLVNQDHANNNPGNTMSAQKEANRIYQYLNKLPVSLKGAVVLRFYQELSFQELSEIMGISLSSAKMRVYRGLEKLAEMMAKSKDF